jgi:ribosomal protein S18 acetylase RimI-like enzyme
VAVIRDKDGNAFEVFSCGDERVADLLAFYDLFEPKGEYQGVPPSQKRARRGWIRELLGGWDNYLVLDAQSVVGHVAVTSRDIPLREVIIFLHQDYRGRGIGTAALDYIKELEKKTGGARLWLIVQSTNAPAIRCFGRVGFEFNSPRLEPEREMILDLEKTE